jgi:DDE superfamily endonuclease
MTKRQAATPAPGPLEAYAGQFDDLFERRNAREAFRRYLEGLLLPAERNKTLTALANAEPIVGAQQPRVQSLQWFLSESTWDAAALHARRVEVLRADPATAPTADGVLVLDETGDRKWGTKTAHIGRQYLGSIGKVDSGVVTVSSLWADERVYWPLAVEPFTPKQHFARGMSDPAYRTKPQIALALVQQAVAEGMPFRAVVADSFYGENDTFRTGLAHLGVGYVLALRPSHAWWAPIGTIGSLAEAAQAAAWDGPHAPGDWQPVERTFRDGHTERWWALEVQVGPYGPQRRQRAVVATTDPATLPEHTTWYLLTNLPAPDTPRAQDEPLLVADLAAVVRLYGLRNWVEQSYKQVKQALGWRAYQVRSDRAMRRHWALVCCAFSFCWWTGGEDAPAAPRPEEEPAARGENRRRHGRRHPADRELAGPAAAGAGLAGAVGHAQALLAGVVDRAPTARCAGAAGLARRGPADHPL